MKCFFGYLLFTIWVLLDHLPGIDHSTVEANLEMQVGSG